MAVSIGKQMIDASDPEHELEIRAEVGVDGNLVLWVNLDGICRFRCRRIPRELLKISVEGRSIPPDVG